MVVRLLSVSYFVTGNTLASLSETIFAISIGMTFLIRYISAFDQFAFRLGNNIPLRCNGIGIQHKSFS
jgi:hypothetical protein